LLSVRALVDATSLLEVVRLGSVVWVAVVMVCLRETG